MTLEDKIFQRYSPNFDKLKEYGFVKDNNSFKLEKLYKPLKNGCFFCHLSFYKANS